MKEDSFYDFEENATFNVTFFENFLWVSMFCIWFPIIWYVCLIEEICKN